jgi:hypothetical protein
MWGGEITSEAFPFWIEWARDWLPDALRTFMPLILVMDIVQLWLWYEALGKLIAALQWAQNKIMKEINAREETKQKVIHAAQKKYGEFQDIVQPIFTEYFPKRRWRQTLKYAQRHGINVSTLKYWHQMWNRDPAKLWRPWMYRTGPRPGRRLFSAEEEAEVYDSINSKWIKDGYQVTYAECRELFMELHKKYHPEKSFKCSDHFIRDFMDRHELVVRRPSVARRPPEMSEADAQLFIAKINELAASANPHFIFNVDETCWWAIPQVRTQWAIRGADHVPIYHDGNSKQNFTAVCAISAARDKLPITVIAKGKTAVCEAQMSDHGVLTTHTLSGWTTQSSFLDWLVWLRQYVGIDDTIHLVLDCYSVHKDEFTRIIAAALNIELLFIPPGLTGRLQPLDRNVFGVMKAIACRLFREHFKAVRPLPRKVSKYLAAEFLAKAWAAVSDETLDEAWSIFNLDTDAFLYPSEPEPDDTPQVDAEQAMRDLMIEVNAELDGDEDDPEQDGGGVEFTDASDEDDE